MNNRFFPIISLITLCGYWLIISMDHSVTSIQKEENPDFVLSEPVQILLYAGDRFLAANIETIRAQAAMFSRGTEGFRLRAHRAASLLNPCQEDNYWFGNASLSWGGAISQGMDVLRNASNCRYWDEWPPFFYGFNQNFFYQDTAEAQRVLKIAAERSDKNKAAFYTYATMLGLDLVKNTKIALKILKNERRLAVNKNHALMLDKRIKRLEGLLVLREAHIAYKKKFGKELEHPDELLTTGTLSSVPKDPMKLGYEFRDQAFHLKQLRVRQ